MAPLPPHTSQRGQAVEHDLLLDARGRLGKRDDAAHRHVATFEAHATAATAGHAAEERAEEVFHVEAARPTAAEQVAKSTYW